MTLSLLFISGLLLCNCLPHLAAGLRGERFPTPFSHPHGVGLSSPLLNFLWGSLNLVIGGYLLARGHASWGMPLPHWAVLLAGFLLTGCYAAIHFGRVRNRT